MKRRQSKSSYLEHDNLRSAKGIGGAVLAGAAVIVLAVLLCQCSRIVGFIAENW